MELLRSIEDWEETLAGFVRASGGRLDVLFNNAGVNTPRGTMLEDLDPKDWQTVVNTNLSAVFYCTQQAFKIMKAGPLLAMRQPLSTLLVVSSMGLLTNLWTFTPVATSLYIGVGAVVLVVSALQFWASHD